MTMNNTVRVVFGRKLDLVGTLAYQKLKITNSFPNNRKSTVLYCEWYSLAHFFKTYFEYKVSSVIAGIWF